MDKIADFTEITISSEELEELEEQQQQQQQSEDLVVDKKEADEKVRLLKEMTKYLADNDINLGNNNDHEEEEDVDEKTDILLFELKSLQVINPITKKLEKIGEWMQLDETDDADGEALMEQLKSNYENYPYAEYY